MSVLQSVITSKLNVKQQNDVSPTLCEDSLSGSHFLDKRGLSHLSTANSAEEVIASSPIRGQLYRFGLNRLGNQFASF